MKALLDLNNRLKKNFEKGGRFEKLFPLFEANDTFLFTPDSVTKTASHVRDGLDLKRMMIMVVVALVPCTLFAMWNVGYQANLAIDPAKIGSLTAWQDAVVQALGIGYDAGNPLACFLHGALFFLPVYIVTIVAGGFWEVLFAIVRKHEVNEGFLVTSLLIPLTLPPTIPLWQVAIGTSFGIVFGKEVFGGTGMNFLNPALVSRAFLFFAYRPDHRRSGLGRRGPGRPRRRVQQRDHSRHDAHRRVYPRVVRTRTRGGRRSPVSNSARWARPPRSCA